MEASAPEDKELEEALALQPPAPDKAATEYAALLEKTRQRDWSEYERLQIVDVTGRDPLGRPVVVFVASRLPAKTLNMDDFLLFCIYKLDAVVRADYVLVYVGSEVSSANRPSVAWLRRAYGLFSRNYKKVSAAAASACTCTLLTTPAQHIQKLYIIHPSTFTRIALKFFKLIVSDKFWRKLVQVEDVSQMHQYISPEQLRLPEACYAVPLRKGQRTVIFGVSLERALAENPHPSGVPGPVFEVLAFLGREEVLQTEGLFRVSGSEAVMRQLRQEMEAGTRVDWAREGADVHSATGVLKQFVRELRVTAVPPSSFEPLAALTALPDDREYARQTAAHLLQLLAPNRDLLRHLLHLLARVTAAAAVNKMSPQNLAVCLAPHLLSNPAATPASTLRDTSTQTLVTRRLIERWPDICEAEPALRVPSSPDASEPRI